MTITRKRNLSRLWVGILGFVLAGTGVGAWLHHRTGHVAGHDHGDHQGNAALSLDEGKRWATDAPLRAGMERIRDATNVARVERTSGAMDAAAAASLAVAINENVSFLVANCKLAPKADAALHVLITDLVSGAAILTTRPESSEGLDLIATTLRRYPEFFDHPQWRPLDSAGK